MPRYRVPPSLFLLYPFVFLHALAMPTSSLGKHMLPFEDDAFFEKVFDSFMQTLRVQLHRT